MSYFEDLKPGDRREIGSYSFTAENIAAFARQFDPQPFYPDAEAGHVPTAGGESASGWHVCAAWMKAMVADFTRAAAERTARGETTAAPGPSPGFRDLKWLKPVLAGDTVTYAWDVLSTRTSESRPQWGLVNFFNTGVNQRGERVLSFEATVFMPRRPR
ncbi:MAG: MaoC family dehydratase [Afipia sp.]|nr:MaoC family dehydratase [Afipia sp.]OJW65549.1 MAG: dehydratase [Afipia sp. 64-13]